MLQRIFEARYNEEALDKLFTELWQDFNDTKYSDFEVMKYNALITYFFKEIELKKQADRIEARWGYKL